MASDTAPSALGALAELLDLHEVGAGPRDDRSLTLGVVGPAAAPRFLLPLDHPDATRAACTAYNGLRPWRTRVNRLGVAAAISMGLTDRLVGARCAADAGPGSLLGHLAEVLGTSDLQVAVGVGNHDAVWKPTLQCFDPTGEPLAYVKVGAGPVGARLVSTEQAALAAWGVAEEPRLVVPGLVATTTWRDMPIICTEPMPGDVARLPPGRVSPWPVRLLDAPLPDGPLEGSSWWVDRVVRHRGDRQVSALLDAVAAAHGGVDRSWARWHGDWVPWNLARSSRGLVAWDWEYSEPGAPVGLDEVHCAYQHERVLRGRPVAEALATVRRSAPEPWLADAHLTMLATRYADLGGLAGTEVGDHRAVMDAAEARTRALASAPRRR